MSRGTNLEVFGISKMVNPSMVDPNIDLLELEDKIAQLDPSGSVNAAEIAHDYANTLKQIGRDIGVDLASGSSKPSRSKPSRNSSRSSSRSSTHRGNRTPIISSKKPESRSSRSSRSGRSQRSNGSDEGSDYEEDDCSESCECNCHFSDAEDDEDCDRHCQCPCHDEGSMSSRSSSQKSDRIKRQMKMALHQMSNVPIPELQSRIERKPINKMIGEIDYYLQEMVSNQLISDEDRGKLPQIDSQSSYDDVERLYNMVRRMHNSRAYTGFISDGCMMLTSLLEFAFDGRQLVFGKYPVNYQGLSENVQLKLRRTRGMVADQVGQIAEKYDAGPGVFAGIELMMPFVSVPFENATRGHGTVARNAVHIDD